MEYNRFFIVFYRVGRLSHWAFVETENSCPPNLMTLIQELMEKYNEGSAEGTAITGFQELSEPDYNKMIEFEKV